MSKNLFDIYLKSAYSALKVGAYEAAIMLTNQYNDAIDKADEFQIKETAKDKKKISFFIEALALSYVQPNDALVFTIRMRNQSNDDIEIKELLISNAHYNNGNVPRFITHYSNYCTFAGCEPIQDEPAKIKNKRVAKALSFIIPGSGQLYAENFRSAIGALLLNGVGVYFTGKAVKEKRYIDSVLIGYLLLYRYYTGNVEAAENSVDSFNEEQFQALKNQHEKLLSEQVTKFEERLFKALNI